MFTGRAEYRLLLRSDNADRRLMPHGRRFGLIDDATWKRFEEKCRRIKNLTADLRRLTRQGQSLFEMLKSPQVKLADVVAGEPELREQHIPREALEEVEIEVVREAGGRPTIQYHGRAAQVAACLGVSRAALSITHTADLAMASVVLENGS